MCGIRCIIWDCRCEISWKKIDCAWQVLSVFLYLTVLSRMLSVFDPVVCDEVCKVCIYGLVEDVRYHSVSSCLPTTNQLATTTPTTFASLQLTRISEATSEKTVYTCVCARISRCSVRKCRRLGKAIAVKYA
jgi:hypothetical protein